MSDENWQRQEHFGYPPDYYMREGQWPPQQDYSRPYVPQPPARRVSDEEREAAGRRLMALQAELDKEMVEFRRERARQEYARAVWEPPPDAEAQAIQVAELLRRMGI